LEALLFEGASLFFANNQIESGLDLGKNIELYICDAFFSVLRIWDTGSGAFLTLGSEIRNRFFSGSRISDPGSPTHIFESLVTIFWVKSSIIFENLPKFFL
jgi:hypothetical protein